MKWVNQNENNQNASEFDGGIGAMIIGCCYDGIGAMVIGCHYDHNLPEMMVQLETISNAVNTLSKFNKIL